MSGPKVYIDGKEGTTGLQIYERLAARTDLQLLLIDEDKRKDTGERKKLLNAADLCFLCLPDGAAKEAVGLIENEHTRVIDCSTAHRTAPGWTYGFPELHGQRARIAGARFVANPGCYATGFISLIRPLTERGLLFGDAFLTCHGLSGYTGAGKKGIAQYEAPDRAPGLDSPRHYALGLAHKHLPEMISVCGLDRPPVFTPIICDFPQGMVVSVPLALDQLAGTPGPEKLRDLYRDYYKDSVLIQVCPGDQPADGFLSTNDLAGKDTLQIFVHGNDSQVLLQARLDNLGKGASGAAVQNMNLMLGFEETTGLVWEKE